MQNKQSKNKESKNNNKKVNEQKSANNQSVNNSNNAFMNKVWNAWIDAISKDDSIKFTQSEIF